MVSAFRKKTGKFDIPRSPGKSLFRLLAKIEVPLAEEPEILNIRQRTLDGLDRALLCCLSLAENDANPLIWCEKHSGKPANVRLTIADKEVRGALHVIDGTLTKRLEESNAIVAKADVRPKSASRPRSASFPNMLTMRGDSGDDDFDDDEPVSPEEEVAGEFSDDEFQMPEESEFDLMLSNLPPEFRLATAEVHQITAESKALVTAAGRWDYLEKTVLPPPSTADSVSRSRATQLVADNRDASQPFLSASSADGRLQTEFYNDARLIVQVNCPLDTPGGLLIAEVAVKCEDGPQRLRYVLRPDDEMSADRMTLRAIIRTPDNAVDANVTLTIRGLVGKDLCLLSHSERHQLLTKPPLSCLTVHGVTQDTCRLTVFQDELSDIASQPETAMLFRLVEREGGVQ